MQRISIASASCPMYSSISNPDIRLRPLSTRSSHLKARDLHDPINGAVVENLCAYAARLESIKFDDAILDKIVHEQAAEQAAMFNARNL